MNITSLRPRFIRYLEPVADVFVRLKITPNQISLLALLSGLPVPASFSRVILSWEAWHCFSPRALI